MEEDDAALVEGEAEAWAPSVVLAPGSSHA